MKQLMGLLMSMLLLSGVVYASTATVTEKAGEYTVAANFEQFAVGANSLTLTIQDPQGKTITDAAVRVRYYMTEKSGPTRKYVEMPYMGSTVDAESTDSGYKAKVDLSMAGAWHIDVKVARSGKEDTAEFYRIVR